MSKNKISLINSIGGKIIMIFTAIIAVAILVVTLISIDRAGAALKKNAFNQLKALQEVKRKQIHNYFVERRGDLEVYANNSAVIMAAQRFINAFNNGGIRGPEWQKWDDYHGDKLEHYIEIYGYYDLFIISPEGDVAFTAAQENDLGQ
ncbi:MAG TPA: hypothetical protein VKS21_00830, partial [Spirochaetota bacterium]|nr:hypothetical protein [Spirochaetota bacterium]